MTVRVRGHFAEMAQVVSQCSWRTPMFTSAGYPWNPNGSEQNIAGICNRAGNVFGMMPHPERVMTRFTHPDWTRDFRDEIGDGRVIFESVLDVVGRRF